MRLPILALLLVAGAAQAADPVTGFELNTSGAPWTPTFHVSADASGKLEVSKIANRSNHTPPEAVHVVLSEAERQQLFDLVAQASTEPKPPACSTHAFDGTHASLTVFMGGERITVECSNASHWLREGSAAGILARINAKLPEKSRVY